MYGTLAGEPITIDPRVLLVGQKRVEGFWLSEWVRDQGVLTMLRSVRKIGKLMRGGTLTTEVGKTFALDDIQAAVTPRGGTGTARARHCCASVRVDRLAATGSSVRALADAHLDPH